MKTIQILRKLIVIAALMAPVTIFAQKWAKLDKTESQITITGTSTLHDWEEKLAKFDCDVQFELNGTEITNIEGGKFICDVKSIESESSLMNSKTYEALKADDHPEINFTLKSIEGLKSGQGKFTCIVLGDVTIAGVTKAISIPVSGVIEGNKISVKGKSVIKLTDFKMTPPTAMLGTIKVDNTISVNFSLGFSL